MIRKQHIGLYVILAVLIYCLVSCGPSSEEKWAKEKEATTADSLLVTAEPNEMENTFESDTLTEEQLNVFQQRAQQKWQDFINYVEIISNKSYDAELREVARKQIGELFTDTTVSVSISLTGKQNVPLTVSGFLDDLTSVEYDSVKVKTDSLISVQPKAQTPETYKGAIQANVWIDGYKNGKVVFSSSAFHKAETVVTKTQKQFGDKSKLIWTAAIGELR